MRLSKRFKRLAWEGLGWSVAAGLALALTVTFVLGSARERDLQARLSAAEARNQLAARGLAVCEATTATLKNSLAVVEARAPSGASTGPMTTAELLAREARGGDACSRAMEAEALVREAAR